MVESPRKKVDRLLAAIITESPIYGIVLNMLYKMEDVSIPTAGVRATSTTQAELVYNPNFIGDMNDEQVKAVIKHELFHVLFGHIYYKCNPAVNIPADIVVNQFIYPGDIDKILTIFPHIIGVMDISKNEPVKIDGITNKFFDEDVAKKLVKKIEKENSSYRATHNIISVYYNSYDPPLPKNLSLEEYWMLMQKRGYIQKILCSIGELIIASHKGWGSKELEGIKAKITEEVKNAIKENRWGDLSGDVIERIKAAYNDDINWKSFIRMFTTSIISIKRFNSRRVWNKKFGDLFPGKKREKVANLLCCIDVSGSMSAEDIKYCVGSIDNLVDTMGIDVTFCQFDTMIKSLEKKYKKHNDVDIKGRGGTDPNCVFDMIRKQHLDYDGIIIFTDGQFGDTNCNNMPRLLWIFVRGSWNDKVPGAKVVFKRGATDYAKKVNQ